jgi:hypothetical protein
MWLSSPETRSQGDEWILGYWTGQNARNVRDYEVGRSVDDRGVLNAVETLCRANPNERLASAAGQTYVNFERDNR